VDISGNIKKNNSHYGYKYRKLPSIMGKWYPFFLEGKEHNN
jgi:hypothetical protein